MGKKKKSKSPSRSLSTGKIPKQSGEEINVTYRSVPFKPPSDLKIHPRQIIPPVPKGKKVPDCVPSPPVELN